MPKREAVLPLSGVRIVDLSWVYAGPVCTRILGLMGAEVVKVESRVRPDPGRRGGPGWRLRHMGKLNCSINIVHPKGAALLKRLVSVSDVLLENYSPGSIEQMGFGYEELSKVKPDIVMVSGAGLGHTGPDKDHVAYGTLIQLYTGWSYLLGYPDHPPIIGQSWIDPTTGFRMAFMIASAVHHKRKTGRGGYVDLSMAEGAVNFIPEAVMDYAMNGRVYGLQANRDERYAPHNVYRCRGEDRWIAIAVTSDVQWRSLCRVMGLPDLADDSRYADGPSRWRNQSELDGVLSAWTRDKGDVELMECLQQAGVPAGASLEANDIARLPQLEARRLYHEFDDYEGNHLRYPGLPWRFVGGPEERILPAVPIGHHNDYVLCELLGLSPAEVEALVAEQVIY